MNIRVEFDVTRNDIYCATKAYYSKVGLAWTRFPLGVLLLIMGLGFLVGGRTVCLGVLCIAVSLLQFASPLISARMMVRRYFSNPMLGGTVTYQLSEGAMNTVSQRGSGMLVWDTFTRWNESKDAFLLIIHKYYFVIVCKRGFSNDGDIAEFRAFLLKRLGQPRF